MTAATEAPSSRTVVTIVSGMAASDGAGVKLKRVVGQPALESVGPFLMLDEFGSDRADDYIAGFPEHPHRGFETVTYMIDGRMRHRDNKGNEGVVGPGGVQWMTTGRGIVHSEMPEQEDGLLRGMQLWLNLPAAHKMTTPGWEDIGPERIPEETAADGSVLRVVAGTLDGVTGPKTDGPLDPIIGEVRLPASGVRRLPLPADHVGFVYVLEGAVTVGPQATAVAKGQAAALSDGASLDLAAGPDGAAVFFAFARPLNEPVAKYGPFVMTTREELHQAVQDFQAGKF
ncbi:MAG: hypothetical protein GVY28_07440 [Alphaproteobacteria bacterium]|nr:hypothetical protein [Alphaproteobacteria bacterium]